MLDTYNQADPGVYLGYSAVHCHQLAKSILKDKRINCLFDDHVWRCQIMATDMNEPIKAESIAGPPAVVS